MFHNRNYVYLLISNVINRLGDSLDTVLFTWLVYSLTNSAGWSAVIFGINQATSVLIQPFAGPLVENANKKKVLIFSDIARAFLVVLVLAVYMNGLLFPWTLVFMTIVSAVVPFDALLAPIAAEMFQGDAQIVSLLSVSVSIGTVCGSLAYSKMQEEKKSNALVTICGIILGTYYIFMALISRYVPVPLVQKALLVIGSVIIGTALGLMITYVQVKFVKEVTKDYIGRVSAIRYSITYACAPIVSFLISALYKASAVKTSSVFVGSGMIIIVLFALANKVTFTSASEVEEPVRS